MFKRIFAVFIGAVFLFFSGCSAEKGRGKEHKPRAEGKKVFFLDSYHKDYISKVLSRGAAIKILGPEGAQFAYFFMDTKNIRDEAAIKRKAREAVAEIRKVKPDIIIAFDDAASKYVIMPYFRDADIPVIFSDVNWDEKQYGYPYKNATGQVEVEQVAGLVAALKKYSKGARVSMLTGDTDTDRESLKYYREILGITFADVKFVSGFDEWKKAFLRMQENSDALFIRNNSGINDWDQKEAEGFVLKNTGKVTGTVSGHLENIVVISFAKDDTEPGEYSANTALEIFDGKKPSEIPVSKNKRAEIILNMKLAKKLGIVFPMKMIEESRFAGER